MSKRKCKNDPNVFCYICDKYANKNQRFDITDFVKECYKNYFNLEISHEDKSWVPHKVCQTCVATLRNWSYGKGESMSFCQPMIWREPKSHDDCYFCACVNLHGYNSKNCKNIEYPNVTSKRYKTYSENRI